MGRIRLSVDIRPHPRTSAPWCLPSNPLHHLGGMVRQAPDVPQTHNPGATHLDAYPYHHIHQRRQFLFHTDVLANPELQRG